MPEKLDNSKHDNIIWLTHFEHAMVHCILARDNLDDFEVCLPVSFMLKDCTPDDILNYNITPEEYNLIYSASQSRPGESNGMYGKTHTQESINKILSHRCVESYQTKEFREKRSAHNKLCKWFTDGVNESFTTECPEGWHLGRKPGQGFKRGSGNPSKYRDQCGEKNHMYGKRGAECASSKPVICIETGEEFESIAAACNKYPGHIGAVCKGKRKKAAGYHWKYKEKEVV